jgi:NAD(P)-dependent dehydrogenase (short-subunit alcohol dehydrogenase family)
MPDDRGIRRSAMTNPNDYLSTLFSLGGQTAVVTGGTGVLGRVMASALAKAGARVGVLGRRHDVAEEVADDIRRAGADALAIPGNVLDRESLLKAREQVLARWGKLSILVNAAGGNLPTATLPETGPLFHMSVPAFRDVVELNLTGTVESSLVFGEAIVNSGGGSVINVSSMASGRALTRVGGYGAAKAAVENLTRWLAVELGKRHGGSIRVNALAPGFFIAEQNRALLVDTEERPTKRGEAILARTPMGRFGAPNDLAGALIWLCGPGAAFVNGVVVPVDGGFSAYGGI